ncbi:MAG: hypothetical protein FWH19_01220 [Treponema sp.]|nr:hypothetical protein [Treponema sp.]
MKKKLVLVLGLFLLFGLTFTGCGDGAGGGGGTPGRLVVNNCPSNATVIVSNSSTPSTLTELALGIGSAVAVAPYDDSSPFNLVDAMGGGTFTRTGSYLVVVSVNFNNYFMGDVRFTNGSATINFNSMTDQRDLPVQ